MSFLNSMDISLSALTAQRLRLDVISQNISNMQTTRTENGGPYRRKSVVFQSMDNGFRGALNGVMKDGAVTAPIRGGVMVSEIAEDQTPFKIIYDPSNPDADDQGYVQMPNVDLLKETVDAMSASRSYDANVTAFNTLKLMASKALEVGR